MILRRLHPPVAAQRAARAASEAFLESQRGVTAPLGFALQIAHSELAGQLAKALLPVAFGELPPEVAEAAWKHDFGWEASDAAQTGRMPGILPRPFPEIPDDELPSWRESLRLAKTYASLTRVLIGRHFDALANKPSPLHQEFRVVDAPRRAEEEQQLGFEEGDLRRWTGAVGFVDLLSLLLCAGVTEPVTLPLAHPADPEQGNGSREVTVTWHGSELIFSEPVFQPGSNLRIEAQQIDGAGGVVHPMALAWTIA